jgi:hypothetical protein
MRAPGSETGVTLSIVVPNRNDARFLARCIGSVREQDVLPDELIVLDDESTDDSVAVIERAIAGCPYARLVRNPRNLGATENSNRGLELARGRFVLFLGANDFVLPGLLSTAKRALAAHPDVGIWSAMVWAVDEEDRFLRIYPSAVVSSREACFTPEQARNLVYRFGNWLTGQTTIYRRDALIALGGFDPRMRAITDLFAALVVASRYGALHCPRPLAAMRIHAGSFLAATVRDETVFNDVLAHIREKGPGLEPPLYTEALLARTERRLLFASLRSVANVDFANARARMRQSRSATVRMLGTVGRFLPAPVVIALLYLVLRPFDVVPTLWYRYVGTMRVVARERMRQRSRNRRTPAT